MRFGSGLRRGVPGDASFAMHQPGMAAMLALGDLEPRRDQFRKLGDMGYESNQPSALQQLAQRLGAHNRLAAQLKFGQCSGINREAVDNNFWDF